MMNKISEMRDCLTDLALFIENFVRIGLRDYIEAAKHERDYLSGQYLRDGTGRNGTENGKRDYMNQISECFISTIY